MSNDYYINLEPRVRALANCCIPHSEKDKMAFACIPGALDLFFDLPDNKKAEALLSLSNLEYILANSHRNFLSFCASFIDFYEDELVIDYENRCEDCMPKVFEILWLLLQRASN